MAKLRRKANLRVRDVADKVGVSNPYISMIEKGIRRPRPSLILKFAEVYDTDAHDLLWRAGYFGKVDSRASILMSKDWDEVSRNPAVRAGLEANKQLWQNVINNFNSRGFIDRIDKELQNNPLERLFIEAAIDATRSLEHESDPFFQDALNDPEIPRTEHFRKKRPKIPHQAKDMIAEIYRMYRTERTREALEQECSGKVSKLWNLPKHSR